MPPIWIELTTKKKTEEQTVSPFYLNFVVGTGRRKTGSVHWEHRDLAVALGKNHCLETFTRPCTITKFFKYQMAGFKILNLC